MPIDNLKPLIDLVVADTTLVPDEVLSLAQDCMAAPLAGINNAIGSCNEKQAGVARLYTREGRLFRHVSGTDIRNRLTKLANRYDDIMYAQVVECSKYLAVGVRQLLDDTKGRGCGWATNEPGKTRPVDARRDRARRGVSNH